MVSLDLTLTFNHISSLHLSELYVFAQLMTHSQHAAKGLLFFGFNGY